MTEFRGFYVKCTEPGLWAVGDCSRGSWSPQSDHGSAAEAADEVSQLNA